MGSFAATQAAGFHEEGGSGSGSISQHVWHGGGSPAFVTRGIRDAPGMSLSPSMPPENASFVLNVKGRDCTSLDIFAAYLAEIQRYLDSIRLR